MSILDTVYNASTPMITTKQMDFIIDNIIEYRSPEDQRAVMKRIDKLTRKEASEIISEIIEYLDYENAQMDAYYEYGYDD